MRPRAGPCSAPWAEAIAEGAEYPPGGVSTLMRICRTCQQWMPPYYLRRCGESCEDCTPAHEVMPRPPVAQALQARNDSKGSSL
jgi:hypothetical protein